MLGWAVTLTVAAAAGAACSRGDTAPPVASVSVTPGKTRVPIGGPIDFVYRFEVAPGASLSADYVVFVQIEDEEGDVFWSDDHLPPTPTSGWRPGQVIEYTRSVFVPPHSRTGHATVRIGLYRDDERLPLQGPDDSDRQTGSRSYRVAAVQIAPESERVFLIRRSGWHPEEFPEGSATAWSWTQRSAVLAFQNPRADVTFFLEYDARPDVFPDGPQVVTIRAGGEPVDTFRADTGDRRLRRVSIPAATLGPGEMAEVQIEVDRAFVPANLPAGGRDSRELGIRVYQTFVDVR
jgi:hypothetical protein